MLTVADLLLCMGVAGITAATATGILWGLREFLKKATPREQQFETLFKQTSFGLVVADETGSVARVNEFMCELVGCSPDVVMNKSMLDIIHEDDREAFNEKMMELNKRSIKTFTIEVRLISDTSDRYVWALINGSSVGNTGGVVFQVVDITERKEAEETIYHLAYYDTLTGLPNRLFFNDHSKIVLERTREQKGRFAYLLVDLDNFKAVNDTYGHHVGDALLKEVAVKLSDVIDARCNDRTGCGCFTSRLGGDEFVMILEHLQDAKDAAATAELILAAFKDPIVAGPHELPVSLSIGIGLYPYDATSVSTLLKASDLALYAAKEKGKNTFFFHEASLNTKFEQEFEYQTTIRYFIETGDFNLVYQPIVDTRTGEICSAEVLFAGNKTKYPNLDVQAMIMVAEDTGLIISLGDAILRRACEEFNKYLVKSAPPHFQIAVNVSMRQLDDPDFVSKIFEAIDDTKMDSTRLALEITETAFATRNREISTKIDRLRAAGVLFAIDDFGRGYSSMSYLRTLTAHKLKIDQSFITDLVSDKRTVEIVRTISLMSQTLGLVCIAEGVETADQYKILREIGVDRLQGYLISPPLDVQSMWRYLTKT